MTLLDGLRVLDLSTEIAGAYATKLLADAGADVIKVEPAGGDPLRRWSASKSDLHGRDGALFQFLNAGKRSFVGDHGDEQVHALLRDAAVVIDSGRLTLDDIGELRASHPRLVVVSITPFGLEGPWAGRPATEFTLQALCGSTASRGLPEREPVHAGGRLGEWISGTYAAVAALAAMFASEGDHVDLSMLECMAVTLGGYGAAHVSMAGALEAARTFPGPFRSVEVPSVERTKDGLVGFCTVTGQQFADLMLVIGHPELADDPRFANAAERTKNLREFTDLLSSWVLPRTTDEVIEAASLLRVPVTAVGRPDTIAHFDHLVERGVFLGGPGGFLAPRPPYAVDGQAHTTRAAAPQLGEHDGASWLATAPTRDRRVTARPGRPLDGLRIIDLTAFWAGPSAGAMLAALGADVIHVESIQRPDGMRFASSKPPSVDGWWEWSGYYQAMNANKRGITLDLGNPRGRELLLDLVEHADALIENFSPRVLDAFGVTWEAIHERNPSAVMVRMPAFGLDGPWRDRTGFAQTMEQACGMAWMSGFPDGLPVIPRGACDPLAGMHAVTALLAALHHRATTGSGHFVEVTMIEAALNAAAEVVIEQTAYGAALHRDGNRGPVAAPQGVYACAGKEQWLALAVSDDDQWAAMRTALGDPDWASDVALGTDSGRRAAHDELDKRLTETLAGRDLTATVEALLAAGVPAAPVLGPVAVIDHEQLRARSFVQEVTGPVVGTHELPSVPFRLASRTEPWLLAGAPTLGQHTREVLTGLLGLDDSGIDALAANNVIGDRPGGRT